MRGTFLAVAALLVVLSVSANAGLLVYEPFAYPNGWLTGRGGALGTTGTWTANDTGNGDWRIHQEGGIAGVVISFGPPVERNIFDGTVNNLLTSGGYVGLPGPLDVGHGEDENFEIGRYMDASIGLDPSVTATFQSGATTWFSYVAVHGWDRNEETPYLTIGTDPSPNESRNSLYNLTNSGTGIGAGGGPPRSDRTDILPRYHKAGASYNLMGAATGWSDDDKNAPSATATMSWDASDDDGFGAANIIVGKIEWDADTGGEDIITVVRFLETDVLSEAQFDALVAAKPDLSSANWTANKPNLDQSRFDTVNIAGAKFFVDEIRIGTTFADVVQVDNSSADQLVSALTALKHHVLNNPPLRSEEIAARKATIDTKFGFDLDYAFAASRGYQKNSNRTLDNTAVAWMTSFNFSPKEQPMASGEKAYQLKGHAKFVDIARLFGWEGLDAFWYSINEDYENGIHWSKHGSDIDDLILRWCESVGVDLRPLFHFWGTHPVDSAGLEAAVAAKNLPVSGAIYDTLVHYKSLVPADNEAFRAFALNWWGHQPSINGYWTEREHARQWDDEVLRDSPVLPNGEMYDESSCGRIRAVIDGLLELYFPGGRP